MTMNQLLLAHICSLVLGNHTTMGISKGHNMYNKAVSRLPRYISQDFCDPLCDQGGLNTSKFAYLTHFESSKIKVYNSTNRTLEAKSRPSFLVR